jgi:hypothetical protein
MKLYCRTTKMKQMMEYLWAAIDRMDAKIDANQVKMDANLKEMRAGQELKDEMLAKMKPRKDGSQPRKDGCPSRRQSRKV